MARSKFDYDEKVHKSGLELSIYAEFINKGNGKMEMIACTISDGIKANDYEMVAGETTIDEVIREFLGQ